MNSAYTVPYPSAPPFSIKPTTTKTKCSGKKWSKNGILYNKRPSSLNILFSMLCICALSLCLLWPKFMHAYWYAGPLRSSLFHELVGVCPFPLLIWRKTMHIGAQAHSTPPFHELVGVCPFPLLIWQKSMHIGAQARSTPPFHELVGVCPFPLLIWRKSMHVSAQARSTPPFFMNW